MESPVKNLRNPQKEFTYFVEAMPIANCKVELDCR
jgi:hypothetical protein